MSNAYVLTLVVCLSVTVGCGETSATKESPANADAGGTGGAGTAVANDGRSACELITDEEVSDIVGSQVIPKERSRGPSSSTCYFAPAPGHTQELMLTVTWSGGREAWDANEKAMALGGQLLGGNRSAAASVMKVEEGAIGDKSSFNPVLGAYVLEGDVLLEFNNLLTLDDAQTRWVKLARVALSRL
jgi:hypothetical protein